MPVQNINDISPTSPLVRTLYSQMATAYTGVRGEINPLNQFASQMDLSALGNGREFRGMFPDTCIGMAPMQGARMYVNQDLPVDVSSGTGLGPMNEETVVSPDRASIAFGAGRVWLKDAYRLVDLDENTKFNVPEHVNRALTIARHVAGIQGDYMMAALTGMRGASDSILYSDKAEKDAAGATFAQMAAGSFMEKINRLQRVNDVADSSAEVVRPLTRLAKYNEGHKLGDDDGSTFDYSTIGAYAADNRLGWEDLFNCKAALKKLGNESRQKWPFRPARIMSALADGGKRRQFMGNHSVWLINHDIWSDLQKDTSWVASQNNLATAQGNSTGLFQGDTGLYRGVYVAAFDKMPIMEDSSGNYYALTLCLGQGALVCTYNTKRDPGSFGISQNVMIRRFMETSLPVQMNQWVPQASRGNEIYIAPKFSAGYVRPAFTGKNGNKVDIGVVGLVCPVENA